MAATHLSIIGRFLCFQFCFSFEMINNAIMNILTHMVNFYKYTPQGAGLCVSQALCTSVISLDIYQTVP